jgi:DNA-binding NarL/FixJ family response regulator
VKQISCSPKQLDRVAPDFTLQVDAADFLRVHLPQLTDKQRRVLEKWAAGQTVEEIAREEGVTGEAIHGRISCALRRLRYLAGFDN